MPPRAILLVGQVVSRQVAKERQVGYMREHRAAKRRGYYIHDKQRPDVAGKTSQLFSIPGHAEMIALISPTSSSYTGTSTLRTESRRKVCDLFWVIWLKIDMSQVGKPSICATVTEEGVNKIDEMPWCPCLSTSAIVMATVNAIQTNPLHEPNAHDTVTPPAVGPEVWLTLESLNVTVPMPQTALEAEQVLHYLCAHRAVCTSERELVQKRLHQTLICLQIVRSEIDMASQKITAVDGDIGKFRAAIQPNVPGVRFDAPVANA
ncbi:hypothetical protein GGX14DRAFT_623713 [Mycena pura]|uniref:Uncharacterized protein n=1 Tax=Mycena pura TaxID=153505 RepID=A0AAD6VJ33_9AGAR|nr:hypothetical protein GGX14DRAFT_623713 [Mycena pura]